ncbi:MAG: ABC transporter ATP-binding protein [Vicinamibacterales bacterium]
MRFFRFLSHYYRRYVWWAVLAVLTIPVYGAASAAVVSLIEPVLTDVLLAQSGPSRAGGPAAAPSIPGGPSAAGLKALADRSYRRAKAWAGVDDRTVVFFTPLLLLSVYLVRGAADFWGGYAFQRIGLGITTDIRNDLYRSLLDQDARFHAAHPSGELVSRVVSDVALMQSALSSKLFDVGQQSVTLVLLALLLVSTDSTLATLVLLTAPAFLFVIVRYSRRVRRASRSSQVRMADVTAAMLEGLRGHPVVKAFGAEDYEHARFSAATDRHLADSLRVQRLSTLSSVLIETLAVAATCVFLIYAGLRVRSGALTVALLVQFLANVWLLYEPLKKLNGANMALQPLIAVGHRVMAVMTAPKDVADRPGARALDGFGDRIVFDRVTVAYEGRTVVDQVSFEIRQGEVVALVGASGAGKTTLASLVPRFLDPDEGQVTIDGHDLRDVTLKSLRSLVGIVTQHTVLFDDTIRNNIAYANPGATMAEVEQAASAAYAADVVRARPGEYEALIGESGVRLSGGERQRIAIARALVRNAPILVLDEATSQLDSEAEAIVHRALQNLMRGRTVLIIAHHLATVRQADRIVVLDRGSVVGTGRHESLLDACPTYARLFEHWMATDHA